MTAILDRVEQEALNLPREERAFLCSDEKRGGYTAFSIASSFRAASSQDWVAAAISSWIRLRRWLTC